MCVGQGGRLAAIRERLIQLTMRNAELRFTIRQLTIQVALDLREVQEGERALARLIEEERELNAANALRDASLNDPWTGEQPCVGPMCFWAPLCAWEARGRVCWVKCQKPRPGAQD